MTERKPPGLSFTSWIDQQISEAAERGAFDDLPGAGKPLPNRGEADAAQAWLRDYALKEGVPVEDLLPTPLKLRRQRARLAEIVHTLRSELEVREVVAELNKQIMEWRRIPLGGPPIFVPLVDEELMLSSWRDGQPTAAPADASHQADSHQTDGAAPRRARWRRRGRPRGDDNETGMSRPGNDD